MSWDEFFEWFRRRRVSPFFWPFEDIDKLIEEMDKLFEEDLKRMGEMTPRDLVREKKKPDGTIERELGPFIYGYSITVGPDGIPRISEFGNVKRRPGIRGFEEIKGVREPLVDVASTDGEVRVIVELPGVEKEDIKLKSSEDCLIVSVDTPERKYHKEIELPEPVDPHTAKSSYKNGILEVVLKKRSGRRLRELKID